ncbi:MAG TPA: ABC transporter ATP-binding protein [Caulobacteraceae bacterium]|nr:ABC transporter ATP-binding protein [Caulobacteraceae bacterium]
MITLRGVKKSYAGRPVVGPLNLTIEAGEFVALLGGSGSGKTTTLKMINRLITPDAGEIVVEGGAAGESADHLRRRIGYVFQEIGLFPHMTVGENIACGPRLARWEKARIAARTADLLSLVDLPPESSSRMPGALSGGQRQRVGVARALAAGPAIMLMDEPFGALDPITRDALGRDYRALHERLGLTTVMVTHDVLEALLLADRVVVLGAGAILADGPPGDLIAGHPDPAVQALMETPRRQARRVEALRAESAHG